MYVCVRIAVYPLTDLILLSVVIFICAYLPVHLISPLVRPALPVTFPRLSEIDDSRKTEEERKRRALGGLARDPGPTGRGGWGGRGASRGRGRGRDGGSLGVHDATTAGGQGGQTPPRGGSGDVSDGLLAPAVVQQEAVEKETDVNAGHASLPEGENEGGTRKRSAEGVVGAVALDPLLIKKEEETPSKVPRIENMSPSGGESAVASASEGGGSGGGGKRPCAFFLRGRCAKGEACTYSHDVQRQNCRFVHFWEVVLGSCPISHFSCHLCCKKSLIGTSKLRVYT